MIDPPSWGFFRIPDDGEAGKTRDRLRCQHPHITFDAQIALADGGRLLETAPQGLQMLYVNDVTRSSGHQKGLQMLYGNDVTRSSGHQQGLQILYVRTLTRFA